MTIAERNNKLKHLITCLKCEVSGKPCDVNCPTQYDAGNMGEIIENLEVISKALEQEPKIDVLDKIRERISLEKLGYPPSAGYYKAIVKVLQIIDKYRAGSEDT